MKKRKLIIDYDKSKRYKTPQGYIVFPNSVLARTGTQEYMGEEIGETPGQVYLVERPPEEVFKPESIASFEGMPSTLHHPEELEVTAETWQQLAKGFVKDVRRDGDHLVGDVWVQDLMAIKAIEEDGIEEISLGYTSDIVKQGDKFVQTNILGNHVAIVPLGRCGGECKLTDNKRGSNVKKKTIIDSLLLKMGFTKPTAEQRKKMADTAEEMGVDPEQEVNDEDIQNDNGPAGSNPSEPENLNNPAPLTADDETKVDNESVNDDEIQALRDENAALKAQIDQMTQAQADSAETQQVANDAKSVFSNLKIGDADNARTIRRKAVVQAGLYTDAQVTKLADCDLKAAYQHARAMAMKDKRSSFGNGLINDAQVNTRKTVDYNAVRGKK